MKFIDKKDIINILIDAYGITPSIVEKSAWGYTTAAFYVETNDGTKYMIKTAESNDEKLKRANKDVRLSEILRPLFPTPVYLKNSSGGYITLSKNVIYRVSEYIKGTAPFDMNMNIFEEVISYLKRFHEFDLRNIDIELPVLEIPDKLNCFLHGDLTASNIIVADNIISGVMDFEDSLLGPAEYDLARSSVFCWFRFKNIPFQKVFDTTVEKYGKSVDAKLILNFAVKHAQYHLNQVVNNKSKYDDEVFWKDDFNFSKKASEEIQITRA
jgi:aminoglycoside phosphotransferase (APT) family kinase protein